MAMIASCRANATNADRADGLVERIDSGILKGSRPLEVKTAGSLRPATDTILSD